MKTVMTLIAPGADERLAAFAQQVGRALDRLGADLGPTSWLAPDRACDIEAERIDPEQAEAAARAVPVQPDMPLDIIAQPAEGRCKRMLIADMDSTIVQEETLDELAAAVGLKDKIAAITARAMNGELDFKEALAERVAYLEGLDESALAETAGRMTMTPGARTLVRTMKANGAHCVLVSGGFTYFTERVAGIAGFDSHHGNVLEIANGKLTGRAVPPLRDKDDKLTTLQAEATTHGLPMAAVLAVGDGANDLPMLQTAGLGIAYHAKPAVREAARFCVDHNDLTALLFAQGYSAADFVG